AAQQQRRVSVRIADVSQPAVSLFLTHDRERVIGAEEACGRKIGILHGEVAQIENALNALTVDVERGWIHSNRLSNAARVLAPPQAKIEAVPHVALEVPHPLH